MAETKKKKSFEEWYEETYGGGETSDEKEKETVLPDIAPPTQGGTSVFSGKKTNPIGSVDIAPGANGLEQLLNQQKAAKQENQKGFFNKGNAFSDGWKFGDGIKTRAATAADAIISAAEGAGGLVEGVTDWLAYGVAQAGEKIDPDAEWHKMLKEGAMQNTLGDASGVRDLTNIDDYSLLGNKTRGVLQGVGQVVTQIAAGQLGTPVASYILTYLSSTGSGMGEAYLDGATDQEAAIYGTISGAVNTLSEFMFAGLGKFAKAAGIGKGLGIEDALAKMLTDKIAKPLLRDGIQYAIKAGGEGLEEVVAGGAEAIAKKLVYEDEKTLRELLKDEQLLDQFVMGALVSGVAQGGDLVSSVQSGTDMITGESIEDIKNAQNVVNTLAEEQIAAAEKDGKKLTAKQKADIKKDIEQALERGELNTEDIERIVGGEDYTKYKAELERQEKLQKEEKEILDSLRSPDNKLVVTKDSIEKQKRLGELRTMKSDQNMVDALKSSLDERIAKATSSGKLAESYENRARRGQAFKADLSKYKGKALETVKKAVESGILNDTRRTHELVDLVAKIAEDKGIDIDFTNNQRLAESGFAINGKQVNGFINANGITLNANSAKALNKVVGHEITHAFEGTELYESLSKAVTEYSKSKGEYDSRLKELTEMYKNVKDADVQKELVADLVGDYIFADEAFVRNLHAGDRNLFQKVFDEVKYLCKVATAGSEQEKQLLEVKRLFEKVYREGEASATTSGDGNVVELEGGTVTKNSLSTWTPETQERVKQDLVKAGYPADKVDSWIMDTNGVAAVIAADKDRLDFTAADNQIMLKDNQEYIKTLDASTLCAKRLIYQGTFDAIQHRLPNQMLSSDELIDLLNMMKKHKVQTPCGVCYVESRRRHLGKFAQDWLNGYNGAYKPNLDEVTTSDGLEKLRKTHPDTYKAFMDAMNKKGSSNPKVVQLRTEYRNEIMSLTPAQISKIEAIGGLRVQCFSDFETPHMLDMMQAVMDMSSKGLHSQAYTKVPNFAWIFGDTGIKINLSLIAEGDGFDADGNLAFSSTEGMEFDEAMRIRDAYSANVGTIIVGANDQHILACMADDRIDFIIPFHRSGWGMKELHMMGMDSYTDYTYGQKEHDLATGKGLANLYPPDYWDYNLTGKENAERYLKLCAQTGREPKFSKFLVDNGDGSYSLQPDGSTDGYWKTLIDFKMYDNNGVGAPQQIVQPNFNMEQAYRVLEEYEGGANELPVANEVVEEFVSKYRAKNIAPTKYSISDTAYNAAVASNDTITLQKMVDDAAASAGYQRLFFHGTPNGDFTKFKGGNPMWITENRDYAETYAKNKSYNEEDERVMELYAKMDNILDITKIDTAAPLYNGRYASKELANLAKTIGVDTSVLSRMAGGTPYTQVWELVNTKKFADLARKQGYDTIKENEFGNITYGVLDPTQLKSAELVTRKHGKVIPLSERFNEKKKDIRFSLSPETSQGVDRIALENIAPTREQIAEMKRVTTPAKKVDTLPMREDIAPKPKVKMQPSQQVAIAGNNIAPPVIGKERSFAKTAIKSDAVDEKVSFADLSQESTHYVPVTNAVTLTKADDKLVRLGYDKAVKHVNAQINTKKVSLEDIALGERLIQEAVRRGDTKTAAELIQNVAILGTELGQKVQALSIIKRLTPAGQLRMLEKVVERGKARGDKAFEGVELTQEMKDEILKTYNEDGVSYDQDALNKAVEDVKQRIADQMKITTMERLNAWRYLAMLGNPKTHIRNIVSNVAMLATSSVKNAVAKSIEPIFSKDSRTKTWGKATQSVKTFADNTATEEKDNITGDGKYSESASIKDKRKLFRLGVLNKLYGLNNDLLAKEDWWFSKTTYKNSLAEFLTANGIKTADDIKHNPELVERGKQYAMERAQIATFRQYSYIASKIGEIERKNAATEIAIGAVLPFKKTPINIAKTALNYSPLGFAKTITYDAAQVKSKKMEASTLIDHLAQNLTGTSLVLLGYALAKAGFINGAGDDDKEGEYDYQLGKQAYSVNIGGSTYSLSWLSPTAMPLFIGANAFEILEEKQEWNGDVVVDTLAQTLDPLSEMSFLSSLDDVLSSYDSGVAKFAGIASSAAQSYVSQYIPTLVSQVASVTDDKKRTTKVSSDSDFKFADQTINQLFYKIPGLRQTLEPSTDIWGKTIYQNDDIVGRAVETFIAPWSRKELIANEIDAEIKELYSISGDTGVIPSIPTNHFVHEKVKYEMSEEEYTEYKQVYGRTANILLERLFATSEYKNASAKQKTAWVKKVYDIAKDDAKENFLEGRED